MLRDWILPFALLLFVAAGPATQVLTINAPRATGVAANDVAALQRAFDAVPASGAVVRIPAGNYQISKGLVLKSGTSVECAPGATLTLAQPFTINGSDAIAIFQNANWNSRTITDHDIGVTGCTFAAPRLFGQNNHGNEIYFQHVRHVRVSRVNCIFPNDCTAFLGSDDTIVENSTTIEAFNACWDHWNHPSNLKVLNNSCSAQVSGIFATAGSTRADTPGITEGFVISGNSVTITGGIGPSSLRGAFAPAIWVQGASPAPSGVSKGMISNNRIQLGRSSFRGSITGTTLAVTGTVVGTPLGIGSTIIGAGVTRPSGTAPTIIVPPVGSGTGGAGTYNVSQPQNVISEAMTAGVQANCIVVNGSGTDIVVEGNTCMGGLRQPFNAGAKGGGDAPDNVHFRNNTIDGTALVAPAPIITLGSHDSTVENTRATNVTGHTTGVSITGVRNQAVNNSLPPGTRESTGGTR